MYLSVVIPVYNEEDRIIESLEKVDNYLNKQHYDSEIIVVDDCSSDNTISKVAKFAEKSSRIKILKNFSLQGKGATVKKGVLNSQGEIILYTDATLSTPIEDVERLLYWFYQGSDVVVGSRHKFEPGVKVENITERKVISNIFNGIIKTLALKEFNDTQCNFKAFTKDAALKLFSHQKIMGSGFDVEILYLAVKSGFSCKEVAVNWKHCPKNKSNIIDDSIKMFKEILQIKEIHKYTFITKENLKDKELVIK